MPRHRAPGAGDGPHRLRWAVGRKVGENAALQAPVREHAAIAQFVIEYGYDGLRAEPVTDAQLAGVVEKRMKDAWEDFAVRWKRDQGQRLGREGATRAAVRRGGDLQRLDASKVAPCASEGAE